MRILRRLLGLEEGMVSEPPGKNGADEADEMTLDEAKEEAAETRRISLELRQQAEETSLDLQRVADRIAAKVENME